MLQTRIRHRLPGPAVIAFLCLSLALLTVSSKAQTDPSRSCLNTVNFLKANGQDKVSRSEIYDNLKDETVIGGVCKLDKTCCSGSAESAFKTMSTGDYKQKIQDMLTSALMPCHNHTFLGEFVNFIRASKVNLVSAMRRTFFFYFTPYEDIFDDFYAYLEKTVETGYLCDMEQEFTKISFEVFLAGYSATSKANGYPDDLPNTHEFRQCMYDFFLDLRGEKISIGLIGFLRAYNLTMRYVRALKMIEEVIEGILDLPLTEQCQSALMKMTYCSQCAGYKDELLPCQGLCMNTLRGCFVDYVDLIKPFQDTSNALTELNKIIERDFNPWNQITLLNSYFSRTATETQGDIVNIRQDLFTQCDQDGPTNRNRRSSPAAAAPAPLPRDKMAEGVRDRRMVVGRAAPPAPYAAINESAYCIIRAIPVFTAMAEEICGRRDIDQINTKCWTGLTYGSYERSIVDLNRSAQRDNPELLVCTKQSRVQKQVAQLCFITQELNILSGVQACSSDDEDCVDTVPHTCNYFQFPDSYEYKPINASDVIDTGSGSGSGTENDSEDDEDEDVCAEGFGATPTIIIGPDTTDKDKMKLQGSGAGGLSSMMSLLTLVLFAAVSII